MKGLHGKEIRTFQSYKHILEELNGSEHIERVYTCICMYVSSVYLCLCIIILKSILGEAAYSYICIYNISSSDLNIVDTL